MITLALTGALLLGAFLATGALPGDRPPYGTQVGDFYPPVVLPSLDGKRAVALSQFAGTKVQFASW
jgi:hypothetical protein